MCCSMFWDGMTGRQCDILSHSPAHRQRDSPLLTVVTRTMKTSYKYRTQYSTVHYSLIKDKSTKTFALFSVPNSVTIHHIHRCHCNPDRINTSNSIKISTKVSILISVNTNAKKTDWSDCQPLYDQIPKTFFVTKSPTVTFVLQSIETHK